MNSFIQVLYSKPTVWVHSTWKYTI